MRDIGGRKRTVTINIKERVEQIEKLEDLKNKRSETAFQLPEEGQYRSGNSEIIINYVDAYGEKASSRAYIDDDKIKV